MVLRAYDGHQRRAQLRVAWGDPPERLVGTAQVLGVVDETLRTQSHGCRDLLVAGWHGVREEGTAQGGRRQRLAERRHGRAREHGPEQRHAEQAGQRRVEGLDGQHVAGQGHHGADLVGELDRVGHRHGCAQRVADQYRPLYAKLAEPGMQHAGLDQRRAAVARRALAVATAWAVAGDGAPALRGAVEHRQGPVLEGTLGAVDEQYGRAAAALYVVQAQALGADEGPPRRVLSLTATGDACRPQRQARQGAGRGGDGAYTGRLSLLPGLSRSSRYRRRTSLRTSGSSPGRMSKPSDSAKRAMPGLAASTRP